MRGVIIGLLFGACAAIAQTNLPPPVVAAAAMVGADRIERLPWGWVLVRAGGDRVHMFPAGDSWVFNDANQSVCISPGGAGSWHIRERRSGATGRIWPRGLNGASIELPDKRSLSVDATTSNRGSIAVRNGFGSLYTGNGQTWHIIPGIGRPPSPRDLRDIPTVSAPPGARPPARTRLR